MLPQLEAYLSDLDTRARESAAAEYPAVRIELPDAVMLDSPDTAKIEELRAMVEWLKELGD